MTDDQAIDLEPIEGASFGARLTLKEPVASTGELVDYLESNRQELLERFYGAGGFLLLPGLMGIVGDPQLLLRLSRIFGPEVEDYSKTIRQRHNIHEDVPEILLITNITAGAATPPPRPDPPLTETGELPVQFPHRKGWHTDQSFRRPPPDISLFFAVQPAPYHQAQTLFANGTGAYEALSPEMKSKVEKLEGWHVMPGAGRSESAVRAGQEPDPLKPHEMPQRQPVVRIHPVTGRKALYLCEAGQMDWLVGPLVDMEPGPDGEGAQLLYSLMRHFTAPSFTYAHHWTAGDLVIYDNRNLIHCATWYESENHKRMMWRTTVSGNPGPLYDGESPSWIPAQSL